MLRQPQFEQPTAACDGRRNMSTWIACDCFTRSRECSARSSHCFLSCCSNAQALTTAAAGWPAARKNPKASHSRTSSAPPALPDTALLAERRWIDEILNARRFGSSVGSECSSVDAPCKFRWPVWFAGVGGGRAENLRPSDPSHASSWRSEMGLRRVGAAPECTETFAELPMNTWPMIAVPAVREWLGAERNELQACKSQQALYLSCSSLRRECRSQTRLAVAIMSGIALERACLLLITASSPCFPLGSVVSFVTCFILNGKQRWQKLETLRVCSLCKVFSGAHRAFSFMLSPIFHFLDLNGYCNYIISYIP